MTRSPATLMSLDALATPINRAAIVEARSLGLTELTIAGALFAIFCAALGRIFPRRENGCYLVRSRRRDT